MATGIASLARIGGLSRAARYDGLEVTAKARETFRASFLDGHGCKICPRIDIPTTLAEPERERRAEALRRLHYERVSMAGSRARSARKLAVNEKAAGGVETPAAEPGGHVHDLPAA